MNWALCGNVLLTKYYSDDQIDLNGMGGACSTHEGRGEAHTGFWWGNLGEREQLEDPSVEGRITLRWIFRKWNVEVWTGSSWLMIGTVGGLL